MTRPFCVGYHQLRPVMMSILFLALLPLAALAQINVVPFKGYINDYAGILPQNQTL